MGGLPQADRIVKNGLRTRSLIKKNAENDTALWVDIDIYIMVLMENAAIIPIL